jgi:uncharacterized protein involved in outer membrane biogenesis
MKKIGKAIKWFFIVIAALLVLLIVAAVALPFVLPLDKIKDFAAAKMSETLKREVKIGKVSFNVFTGIGIDNLYIGNRAGFAKKPFVSASKIELKYDLWSLFSGRFKINKVALIKPEILLEKKGSQFNFSDLIPAPKTKTKPPETKKNGGKPPVMLDVSSVIIKGAALSYIEYTAKGEEKSGFNNLDLTVSGLSLDFSKPISLASSATIIYQGKPVPVSISALANINMAAEKARISNLKLAAAGETLLANISVAGFSKNQDVKFDLKSDKINIDKFLAIVSGKPTPKQKGPAKPSPKGALTDSVNKMSASIPAGLKVVGDISLKNIMYKEMELNALNLNLSLANKVLKITSKDTGAYNGKLNANLSVNFTKPGLAYAAQEFNLSNFDASPSTNAAVGSFLTNIADAADLKDKIYGTLNLNAKIAGAGVEMPEMLKNAAGDILFELKDGKIKKMNSLAGIADKIGLSMLKKDMEIKIFKADSSIVNGILKVRSLHIDNGDVGDVKIDFVGSLDLIKKNYLAGNVITLSISPKVAPKELDSFKDKSGWAILEFELAGPLSRPIPIPKLNKQIKQLEEKAKGEVQKEIDKQKEKLQKEAEDKLKDLIKF